MAAGTARDVITRALERRKLPADGAHLGWGRILGAWPTRQSLTGQDVSEATALSLSTVFAAVRLLSFIIASLPLHLFQRVGEQDSKRVRTHPLADVLGTLANPRSTAFQVRAFMHSSVFLRGNALAVKDTNSRQETVGLYPIRWDQVTPGRDRSSRQMVFEWHPTGGEGQAFLESEVWHPIGLSQDGVLGLSPVLASRETFGQALAQLEYSSRFFANDATPRGVLMHEGTLGGKPEERDAAIARLRGQWSEVHQGGEGSHRIAVLEEGMKFEGISLNPSETQLLETRRFTREEIATLFGLPPHLVGALERATFSNIEQQSLEFLIYHLTPVLVSLEQTMGRDLLTEGERARGFYLKHQTAGLLRGDSTTRANFYRTAITTGWMTRNEARVLEEMRREDGLDEFLVPLNMATEGSGGDGFTPGNPLRPMMRPGTPTPEPQPDDAALPPARALPAPRLVRAREAPSRPELARVFIPLLEDTFGKVVETEIRQLSKKLGLHLDQRSADTLQLDLEDFYALGGPFHESLLRRITPPLEALARVSFDRAAAETPDAPNTNGLETFVAALISATADRYTIASRKGLVSLVQGEEDQLAADLVRALFDKWKSERPGRIAARESVQTSRATAVEAFRRAGVQTKRWVTRGEDCEFCAALDGEVVGVSGVFLEPGQTLTGREGGVFQARGRIGHAPLHRGCDCDVVPV